MPLVDAIVEQRASKGTASRESARPFVRLHGVARQSFSALDNDLVRIRPRQHNAQRLLPQDCRTSVFPVGMYKGYGRGRCVTIVAGASGWLSMGRLPRLRLRAAECERGVLGHGGGHWARTHAGCLQSAQPCERITADRVGVPEEKFGSVQFAVVNRRESLGCSGGDYHTTFWQGQGGASDGKQPQKVSNKTTFDLRNYAIRTECYSRKGDRYQISCKIPVKVGQKYPSMYSRKWASCRCRYSSQSCAWIQMVFITQAVDRLVLLKYLAGLGRPSIDHFQQGGFDSRLSLDGSLYLPQ